MNKHRRSLYLGLFLLASLFVGSLIVSWAFGDSIHTFTPSYRHLATPPSRLHWLGTDEMGRDLFLRCLSGAKLSLGIGFVTVFISTFIGTIIGLLSGFFTKILDPILMRFTDLMMGIPTLFLMLALQSFLGPSLIHVVLVMGLTSWMGVARLVRAEVLSIKERPFVLAAHARGLSRSRVIFRHILPHCLPPLLVATILGMGNAILAESMLSFLGLGVQPPYASWGSLLENSLSTIQTWPWLAIAPGIWITSTVFLIHWIGDQLRAITSAPER